jgi:hypothetical protein
MLPRFSWAFFKHQTVKKIILVAGIIVALVAWFVSGNVSAQAKSHTMKLNAGIAMPALSVAKPFLTELGSIDMITYSKL